jgi:hypothetical protein
MGIGVVALAPSLIFGRHAALSQGIAGDRPLDALAYTLVVVPCAALVGRRVIYCLAG